jgi:hypothetical protein
VQYYFIVPSSFGSSAFVGLFFNGAPNPFEAGEGAGAASGARSLCNARVLERDEKLGLNEFVFSHVYSKISSTDINLNNIIFLQNSDVTEEYLSFKNA